MRQRTFTPVWAALGLGALLAWPSQVYAADDCLPGPKGATPAGQHWYYRIDRATKKQCWYLADHGAKTNKTASAKPVARPAGPEAADAAPATGRPTPLAESVADARAELTTANALPSVAPTSPAPQAPQEASEPQASPSNATTGLTAHDLITQAPTALASRWPLPNEFQPAEPQSAQTTQTQTTQTAQPASTEPPSQPVAPQNTVASVGPLQIFLCVLAIALALTALLGRVIINYISASRRKRAARHPRQIWPDEISNGAQQSYARMITPERRAHSSRAENDAAEIERLLRGGSRRVR